MAKVSSSGTKLGSILVAVALVGHSLVVGIAPAQAQVQTYSCPTGFGALDAVVVVPPILLDSLKVVPNPVIPRDPFTGQPHLRADLVDYVADLTAAIQLGKALFWDMQVGSDNKTACATCHHQAGADGRNKNQLNPGANAAWETGYGPNYQLWEGDFPFTKFDAASNLVDRTDNIVGSQGVRNFKFMGIGRTGAESIASIVDPVFNVTGKNVRQVTGKNTPSAVNAVFNHRQFFNGRAQPEFNGVNPFGNRDASARVWVVSTSGKKATTVQIDIHISNASLASQAVGPVLNSVEMSAAGRTFPDVGQKLLAAKPLNGQKVSPSDSVLGPLADVTTGLKTTYTALIKQAFQPKWWNGGNVPVGGKSYSMMAANFSLFWGLSVMLYEATLVSDDSPMDQYLALVGTARPGPTDPTTAVLDQTVTRLASEGITVTRESILNGLNLFERPVAPAPSFPPPPGFGAGCTGCHFGGEFTSASMRNLTGGGLEPGDVAFKNAGFDMRMERMFTKMDWTPPGPLTPVPLGTDKVTYDPSTYSINVIGISGGPVPPIKLPVAVYDAGWYNLGVRPTAEDPGLDGTDPFGAWLSWTRWFQSMFASVRVPGGGLACATSPPAAPITSPFFGEVLNPLTGMPFLAGPLKWNEVSDVAGTFKVPGLHNVELTGPHFHNGGKSTLRQVIDFYDDGGNFDNLTRSPLITPLGLSATQMDSLIAFLLSLTDERVRWQEAPFDHPQLFVPNGDNPAGTDAMKELPAIGAWGSSTPLGRFLNLNPFHP